MDALQDSPEDHDDSDLAEVRTWRCAACNTPITDARHLVCIDGDASEHMFPNPAGLVFTILTVRQASNVAVVGEPSTEFAWFPGRTWQVVVCARCHAHLGWLFEGTERFFGLVRERLRR